MAAITAAMVKELRERTGIGMMDCKKALTEADGDMARAADELRKSSAFKAAKRSSRTAADGLLGIRVAPDRTRGSLVEVNIETDFAARNEKFVAFVARVSNLVFDRQQADVAVLLASGVDVEREKLVHEIGEHVSVRRAELLSGGRISSYLHLDGRKAALVSLDGGDDDLGRDVCMHIVAMKPMVVEASQLAPEIVAAQRVMFEEQAKDSGKPPEIVAKMVEGRVRKFLAESSLVDQAFVKDPNVKVGKLLADRKARCRGFVRFEVGEGIDREQTDFAAEVAAQVKGRG